MDVVRFDGAKALGIKEVTKEVHTISIYPNPATDGITFNVKETFSSGAIASIYSIDGRLISEHPLTQNNTFINVNELSKGIYFIKVAFKEKSQMIKFVKE
jgi:hypothetical protein